MTNANRFNQTELEISFLLYGDYDSIAIYAAEQNNKLFEEDTTTPGKRNKGKHDTHARKRKKGVYAGIRHINTCTVRESRKYPYSQMLGKGKRHDHVYQDEPSNPERKAKAKAKAEFALYLFD